ncbi:FRAS1-related extracellular matrix protein 1 [Dissostichus eleginoides]|uniref:FRAS1-related extracellular matrix protein 1 n=1 Tax=Dissostichus eleginoides TaxID=100907 RepID=A0AAD9BUL6_DISEL|nr:FRAS1-related extracellular matrix protein 1 [Dissostichus eleginoides]
MVTLTKQMSMTDKVILIKENKTWEEALTYCRENHRDLVSITDSHQQRWVQKRAKMADTEFVWLGMRYTCTLDLWFWVSDRSVCNPNLAPKKKTVRCDSAAVMERDGKWYKKADIFTATSSLFSNMYLLSGFIQRL